MAEVLEAVNGKTANASYRAIRCCEHADKSKVGFRVYAAGVYFINTAHMLKNIPNCLSENIWRGFAQKFQELTTEYFTRITPAMNTNT